MVVVPVGGGSKGVLSNVGVGSGDDDDDYLTCFLILMFSNATKSALRYIASAGVVVCCLGCRKPTRASRGWPSRLQAATQAYSSGFVLRKP